MLNLVLRDPSPPRYEDGKLKDIGSGGVRIIGGRRITVFGGLIESNDDAMALVPADLGADNPIGMAAIEDVIVGNIGLRSFYARAVNIGMSQGTDGNRDVGRWRAFNGYHMANSIRRVVTDVLAESLGDRAVRVHNDVSSGVVEDITLSRIALRLGPTCNQAVIVASNAGDVRRVKFEDVSVFADPETTIGQAMVEVKRVEGFTWVRGRVDAAVAGLQPTIRLSGVIGGAITDVLVGCSPGGGILIDDDHPTKYDSSQAAQPPQSNDQVDPPISQSAPPPADPAVMKNDFGLTPRKCEDFVITNGAIENIPANATGLAIQKAVNCGARGVRFTPALTATTPNALTWAMVDKLAVTDPAKLGEYSIRFVDVPNPPQPFLVYLGTGTDTAIGQGLVQVGTADPAADLVAQGLRLRVKQTGGQAPVAGGIIKFTVSKVDTGVAASLGTDANACFLDTCDIAALPKAVSDQAAVVQVTPNRQHRVTYLFAGT